MAANRSIGTRLADESGFGLVETLIALTILVIGLIAVSGLSLASADQARIANWRSQQATAAQLALETVQQNGWGGASSGYDTITVAGHDYVVKVSITKVTSRIRDVTVAVDAVGDVGSRAFTTRLYKPRPLPAEIPVTP